MICLYFHIDVENETLPFLQNVHLQNLLVCLFLPYPYHLWRFYWHNQDLLQTLLCLAWEEAVCDLLLQ